MSFAKTLLSIWILFHLTVIFTVPNSMSITARILWPWIAPYASQLGINCTWQFFSPIPTPASYLRYTVLGSQKMDSGDPELDHVYYFPPKGRAAHWLPNDSRVLGAARYFTTQPERLRSVLGPYLCAKHPGAVQISLQHILEIHPQLGVVGQTNSYVETAEKMQIGDERINCTDDEVEAFTE